MLLILLYYIIFYVNRKVSEQNNTELLEQGTMLTIITLLCKSVYSGKVIILLFDEQKIADVHCIPNMMFVECYAIDVTYGTWFVLLNTTCTSSTL